jgi:hypothetical protein
VCRTAGKILPVAVSALVLRRCLNEKVLLRQFAVKYDFIKNN